MKIIKKTLIVLIVLCLCFGTACKKPTTLYDNVSRVRNNIFKGQTENYEITLYPELRESPLIADGKIGQIEKVVIVKLRVKNGEQGNFKVCFTTDKKYTMEFTFSAYSDCYISKINIESLPISRLTAQIYHNDSVEEVVLESMLNPDTITYQKALEIVYANKTDYVEKRSQNKIFDGEIYIRLIEQGGKNFWYVGLITADQTLALLIDGKSQKIIAEKTILNKQ